jgi:drug/metabolite transporter (DMT)-like permease
VALALGSPLAVAWSVPFAASLLYLSLVGSVLAFGAYFTLLARVGAARASYVGVMTPLVALVVSTLLEHFAWRPATVAGVVLAVLGNVLALRPPARGAP